MKVPTAGFGADLHEGFFTLSMVLSGGLGSTSLGSGSGFRVSDPRSRSLKGCFYQAPFSSIRVPS